MNINTKFEQIYDSKFHFSKNSDGSFSVRPIEHPPKLLPNGAHQAPLPPGQLKLDLSKGVGKGVPLRIGTLGVMFSPGMNPSDVPTQPTEIKWILKAVPGDAYEITIEGQSGSAVLEAWNGRDGGMPDGVYLRKRIRNPKKQASRAKGCNLHQRKNFSTL